MPALASAYKLKHLSRHAGVILLQEHWFWPFKLQKLSSTLSGFSAFGLSDSCLCEGATLNREYGGIANLWIKSPPMTPVTLNTKSDHTYATQLPVANGQVSRILIFNVYISSSDTEISKFTKCIHDLEEEINRVGSKNTAMVIAGNFNAHLGTLAGPRGSGPPSQIGFLLKDFIDRNKLFVASYCSLSHGPSYT